MTTKLVQPNDIMVDYSFARPDPNSLASAGVVAVSRYISSGSPKNLTLNERDRLWAAGLGIMLNWEQSAGAPLGGASIGATHGATATRQAEALHYPLQLPICVSVDTGVAPNLYPAVVSYFRAFKDNCPWPLTMYGGTNVGEPLIEEGLVSGIWKAGASSWSTRPSAYVFLQQHARIVHPQLAPWTGAIDDNTVRQAFKVWTGPGLDPPAPFVAHPLEVRNVYNPPITASAPLVADLQCPTGGAWLLFRDGSVWTAGGAPFYGNVVDKPYWLDRPGRVAADLRLAVGDDGIARYVIVSDTGEHYGPIF